MSYTASRRAGSGRYVVICAVPTGSDPAAFLAALERATDNPPTCSTGQ